MFYKPKQLFTNMKTSIYSILFLFVFIMSSGAQTTNEMQFKLIDRETSEPISFATVMIKGTKKGVIADYNGEFRIPIQYYEAKNSIIISSIGFTTSEKEIRFLIDYIDSKGIMEKEKSGMLQSIFKLSKTTILGSGYPFLLLATFL